MKHQSTFLKIELLFLSLNIFSSNNVVEQAHQCHVFCLDWDSSTPRRSKVLVAVLDSLWWQEN